MKFLVTVESGGVKQITMDIVSVSAPPRQIVVGSFTTQTSSQPFRSNTDAGRFELRTFV